MENALDSGPLTTRSVQALRGEMIRVLSNDAAQRCDIAICTAIRGPRELELGKVVCSWRPGFAGIRSAGGRRVRRGGSVRERCEVRPTRPLRRICSVSRCYRLDILAIAFLMRAGVRVLQQAMTMARTSGMYGMNACHPLSLAVREANETELEKNKMRNTSPLAPVQTRPTRAYMSEIDVVQDTYVYRVGLACVEMAQHGDA